MSTGIDPIIFNDVAKTGLENTFETNRLQKPGSDFGTWLTSQLNELDSQIKTAESGLRSLATGETNNIHQVMLSLEKAKTSMELTVQIRNRLLEGYQEVMRMQI